MEEKSPVRSLTDEQLEKLKELYESENPKPRNRAERRLQIKNRRRKKVGE